MLEGRGGPGPPMRGGFHLHLPRGSSRACRQEPGSHLCVSDASVQTFSLCFSLPHCAVCFLVFEFCGVFMFSGYKSFLRPLISKYFLLVYGLPFYSCNHPSKYQIFSFDEVQFCFFHLSITLLVSKNQGFTATKFFSGPSRIFFLDIQLYFIFSCPVYFSLIFV